MHDNFQMGRGMEWISPAENYETSTFLFEAIHLDRKSDVSKDGCRLSEYFTGSPQEYPIEQQ